MLRDAVAVLELVSVVARASAFAFGLLVTLSLLALAGLASGERAVRGGGDANARVGTDTAP